MELKKLMALLMTGAMAGSLLAGCGATRRARPQEMTEITVVLRTLGTVDEYASEAVEEAVNEITQSQIQVAVDLLWVDSAKYETQVPMMIAGSEKIDLMMYTPNPSTTYNTMMAQNQLMDITDYISEYGPEIQNTLGTTCWPLPQRMEEFTASAIMAR